MYVCVYVYMYIYIYIYIYNKYIIARHENAAWSTFQHPLPVGGVVRSSLFACPRFTLELLANFVADPHQFADSENWKWNLFDFVLAAAYMLCYSCIYMIFKVCISLLRVYMYVYMYIYIYIWWKALLRNMMISSNIQHFF